MYIFLLASLLVTMASATCAPCSCGTQPERNNDSSSSSKRTSPFVETIHHQRVVTITTATINATPAVVLIGKSSGEVWRCLHEDPAVCEVLYSSGSEVDTLHVAGEHLYVGLVPGVILKCNPNQKESCTKTFQVTGSDMHSMTSEDGFLYAGLYNGTVLRCPMHEPNSCQSFYMLGSPVFSAISFKKHLYFGLGNGHLMRCSLGDINSCKRLYNTKNLIPGLSIVGNSIFPVTWNGSLWNCTHKSDGVSSYCVAKRLNHAYPRDVAFYNGVFYSVEDDKGIYACQWADDTPCTNYGNFTNMKSIAVSYGTYQMQGRYSNENTACSWQSKSKCPPFVTYYTEQERAMLEVFVQDGRLYNYQGLLVDTSDANEGRSGAAAIFAMGPDGRVLLSNLHSNGLLHSSSLFAGNPVSGAGEMVVKNGVIEKIVACSDHYLPDTNLNEQVVEALRAQGYSDPIVSLACSEDEYGQNENSNVQ